MPYYGPDTTRTAHACELCNHFGGWMEADDGAAWCNRHQFGQALSYSGCCSWQAQPPGWIYPPERELVAAKGKNPHQPKPMGANVR
ncbi:hypothetical protein [Hydrogenophaga sp.]|uniref:hypothetical protein n=1 Tax=Hydrogenophaga sp. TaxID=1904254 RepID=UPI003D0DA9A2